MGAIFRFPIFLVGCYVWIFVGGFISFLQWCFLPVTLMLAGLSPGNFGGSVKEVVTFGTLRRGFGNLVRFLKYGL